MAVVPTPEEVGQLQVTSAQQVSLKMTEQLEAGKGVEFPAYGPGVIPEDVWQAMKEGQAQNG